MKSHTEKLLHFVLWLMIIMSFFIIVIYAQSFFIPLALAVLLTFLVLPLNEKLESWGWPRWLGIIISVLLILIFISGTGLLITSQVINFAGDIGSLKQNLTEQLDKLRQTISDSFGISAGKQVEYLRSKAGKWIEVATGQLQTLVMGMTSALGNLLLIIIYIILMLQYREKFSNFLLKITRNNDRHKTKDVVQKSVRVSQSFVLGKFILIVILGVLYGAGMMVIGIEHAWLFAIIAALISLIPYIGPIIGGFFPVAMALLTADWQSALGVVAVFAGAQLLESYVLTPWIVGSKVNLNPFFSIIIVILGGVIWGIAGMILAIPYLAILKIIFDHVEQFKPFGYLIGETKDDHGSDE